MNTRKNNTVPRGIEILVKKAAVDSKFRSILIEERADAASRIKLKLDPSEVMIFNGIPEKQLRAIIKSTKVAKNHRTAFLGYAAAAMLATLGLSYGCGQANEEVVVEEANPLKMDKTLPEPDVENAGTDIETESSGDIKPDKNNSISGNFEGTGGTGTNGELSGILLGGGVSTGTRPDGNFEKRTIRKISLTASVDSIAGPGSSDVNRTSGAINGAIRRHLPGIKNLYNSELKKNPDIPDGNIVIRFTIGADGSIFDAFIVSNIIGSSTLANGILSRIRGWRFPPASDEVTVIVPFTFIMS